MDFKEFVNKLEQDLKDFLSDTSPGAQVRQTPVEKLQAGSYTGISITPADTNVGMNINADQLYAQMQDGRSYEGVLAIALSQVEHGMRDMPAVDMGAGTNVQDRLVAVHHLDVGWRPADMTQRNGRIIRQGNRNKEVQVYQYVTEGTFDAYLWQTLENKQKFISQVMTSKSPVRACDDVDEQALSYAEIKALCAGDDRIREKMDLDVDVARLKVLKADHQSQQYRLEDKLLKYFPAEIEKTKGFIAGFEADIRTVEEHPQVKDGFCGITVGKNHFTDKTEAGEAIIATCKEYQRLEPVPLGEYRGFKMELSFDSFTKEYQIAMKGEMTHRVSIGTSALGNLTRLDNALAGIPDRMERSKQQLTTLYDQQSDARAEVGKPFPQEAELAVKSARLAELDAALNMDDRGEEDREIHSSERPSVLADLKSKSAQITNSHNRKDHEEVL